MDRPHLMVWFDQYQLTYLTLQCFTMSSSDSLLLPSQPLDGNHCYLGDYRLLYDPVDPLNKDEPSATGGDTHTHIALLPASSPYV